MTDGARVGGGYERYVRDRGNRRIRRGRQRDGCVNERTGGERRGDEVERGVRQGTGEGSDMTRLAIHQCWQVCYVYVCNTLVAW